MFAATDTETGMLWFRLRDCAAHFGSLFCHGWRALGELIRTDCTFLPEQGPRQDFDHALVRDLGLTVLAEWNDPDVWLWMRGEGPSVPPQLLGSVYEVIRESQQQFHGPLAGKAFSPEALGWRCCRCGRFPSRMSMAGRLDGIPMYVCSGSEVSLCLS